MKTSEPMPVENPFLRAIRDETYRLHEAREEARQGNPKLEPAGFLVSCGHLDDVLEQPVHSKPGAGRLDAFCDEHGLDAEFRAPDGIRFTVRPAPDPTPGPAGPAPAK